MDRGVAGYSAWASKVRHALSSHMYNLSARDNLRKTSPRPVPVQDDWFLFITFFPFFQQIFFERLVYDSVMQVTDEQT